MLDVERWAELRREHFVRGVSIKELVRRTGLARNTVRTALRAGEPPAFRVPERSSMLEPFKDEIHRLLSEDPKLSGVRVRELLEPLGFDGGKTIVDDYLREVRPLFLRPRRYQRTVYRPGEVCQWDLWETSRPVPVGHGQDRRAWVVVACLSGQLPVGWYFCEPSDPQAKGVVERLQGYMETNFEPGRRFANHLDFQLQLDDWFARAKARTHKTLRARPIDRLIEEREVMRPLPEREPDTDRRWVVRVPPDPHLTFDTVDYSLDPELVGRRVEVRVSQREVVAVALDTGELACRHERCFAKHRTVTALEHARPLRARHGTPGDELLVEQRPLSVYDQLIA